MLALGSRTDLSFKRRFFSSGAERARKILGPWPPPKGVASRGETHVARWRGRKASQTPAGRSFRTKLAGKGGPEPDPKAGVDPKPLTPSQKAEVICQFCLVGFASVLVQARA